MRKLHVLPFALALLLTGAVNLPSLSSAQESSLSREESDYQEIEEWFSQWLPWAPPGREADLARARELQERADRLRAGQDEYGVGGLERALGEEISDQINSRIPGRLPDLQDVQENVINPALGFPTREERIEQLESDARALINRHIRKKPSDKEKRGPEGDDEEQAETACRNAHGPATAAYYLCMGDEQQAQETGCRHDHGPATAGYYRCMGDEQQARRVESR